MKVLLVDADSQKAFPNLALMKLSAFYKRYGAKVELIKGIPETAPLESYDDVFISCIYFQNASRVQDYADQFKQDVVIGGSGWDYRIKLMAGIEHIMPDYSLYNIDFSMGFTSRGCIRKCPWCIVPKKEGKMKNHANVKEFHDPRHKKIVLLDNNFFASPQWNRNLEYIMNRGLKVNFNQGLDIRIFNDHKAYTLAQTKAYSWNFKARGFHVAFDTMRVEKQFNKGMKILIDNGNKPHWIMVYILVGFNTTFEQDLYRIDKVLEWGAKPYIMRYNQNQDSKLKHLARYINRKYYEFIDRSAYKGGVLAEVG